MNLKPLFLLPLAAAFLLVGGTTGCMTSPGGIDTVTVNSGSRYHSDTTLHARDTVYLDSLDAAKLRYREIRIDAFSLYWLGMKNSADSIRGDTLFYARTLYVDNVSYPAVQRDFLLNPAYDKTDSLPPYTLDSASGALFFTAQSPPTDFSCFIRNSNKDFGDYADTLGTDPVILETYDYAEGRETFYHNAVPADSSMEINDCTYVPGKGFQVGPYPGDQSGQIIIRY